MNRRTRAHAPLLASLTLALLLALPPAAPAAEPDDPALYPDAPGKEQAMAFCGACHGFRIVAAQGMTRLQWDESLKWMVRRHGMPELDGEDLDVILGYLEKAFPPKPATGRPGFSNPFAPRQ